MEPDPIQEGDVISLPEEKATLAFVRTQGDITSPAVHFTLPLLLPVQGFSPFANVPLSLTKLLDLVCMPPDSTAKGKRAPARGDQRRRGVCAAGLEAPIHMAYRKFHTPSSNPDGGPRGQIQPLDNAVSTECI